MTFQIKDAFGKGCFYTEYLSCIPFDSLDSMESVGFTFYIDGKRVSKSYIRNNFKSEELDSEEDESKVVKTEVVKTELGVEETSVESNSVVDPGFPITAKTIICVNTGKMYKNQKAAADEYKVDPANISYCVTTGKSYKGLFFKRVIEK